MAGVAGPGGPMQPIGGAPQAPMSMDDIIGKANQMYGPGFMYQLQATNATPLSMSAPNNSDGTPNNTLWYPSDPLRQMYNNLVGLAPNVGMNGGAQALGPNSPMAFDQFQGQLQGRDLSQPAPQAASAPAAPMPNFSVPGFGTGRQAGPVGKVGGF